jgi:hypothetical protein
LAKDKENKQRNKQWKKLALNPVSLGIMPLLHEIVWSHAKLAKDAKKE